MALTNATVASALLDLQAASLSGDYGIARRPGSRVVASPPAFLIGKLLLISVPSLRQNMTHCWRRSLILKRLCQTSCSGGATHFPLPAEGVAAVSVGINVASEVAVDIESDLKGVSVDLPFPWGKSAESRAPLKVSWRDREWAPWEGFLVW